MSEVVGKTPNLIDIISLSGIHPLKIRNVYVFGSRVYGYNHEHSDFDILMIAPNLEVHKEIKHPDYNIHIVNPDKFKSDVASYKLQNLECIWAPAWAKLQEKEKINLEIVPDKVKKFFLAQSYDTWHNAKMKFYDGDTVRGLKSAFHSLRALLFGIHIIREGKITDFSLANGLYKSMYAEDFYEWIQMKEKYLPLKQKLEEQLKKA